MRWTVTALMLAVWLAGCALDPGQAPAAPAAGPSTPAPAGTASPSAPASAGTTITGTLGGDARLEGGCVWLETEQGRIEPQWPDGYTTTTEPVALLGPDGGTVAEEGDRVTVTGRPAEDAVTICQVGQVWAIAAVTVPAGG